jgi:DTW domain-containing protein YfiP
LSRCLCKEFSPIFNQTELIILQHPSETKHALNTVKLMAQSFQNIRIFIGENFNDHSEVLSLVKDNQSALIFPTEKSQELTLLQRPLKHLIFIDASWKKAKKIFYASTILHELPIYKLMSCSKSQYRLRSSQFNESLSTLEATLATLDVVEEQLCTESLRKAFIKMIDFQIEKMGEETYQKNYLKKE